MIRALRALTYACAAFLAVVALTLISKTEMDADSFRVATLAAVSATASFAIADRMWFLTRLRFLPLRVVVFGVVVVLLSGMLLPVVGELVDALRTSTAPSLSAIATAPILGVFIIVSTYYVVIPLGILASAVDSAITRRPPMPPNPSLERP